MNTFLKTATAAAISMIAWSGSASALLTPTQTQTFSFGPDLNASTTLSFSGFNAGLGTLTEVILTFNGSVTLVNAVINIGTGTNVGTPSPLSAIATYSAVINFGSPALTASTTFSTPGYVGFVPGPAFTAFQVGQATGSISASASETDPGDLANYIGGVNLFSVVMSSSGTQGGSVPNTIFSGNSGSIEGSVSLQYRYNEPQISTPEPASMMLVGAGLLGLGLTRRRRS